MHTKDALAILLQDLLDLKRENRTVVSVEALISYVENLEESAPESQEEGQGDLTIDLMEWQAHNEIHLKHYEAHQRNALESSRSVITAGQAALRSVTLINGGAAVAMLALIGNIWAKGAEQATVDSLSRSIGYFASGVLAASVASGGTYISQYCLSLEKYKLGDFFNLITVLVVIAAYVLFGFGTYESYLTFIEHLPNNAGAAV